MLTSLGECFFFCDIATRSKGIAYALLHPHKMKRESVHSMHTLSTCPI